MSSRVTRSSARPSAATNSQNPPPPPAPPATQAPSLPPLPPPPSRPPPSSRKRKANPADASPDQPDPPAARATRTKRPKAHTEDVPAHTHAHARPSKAKGKATMAPAASVPPVPLHKSLLTSHRPPTDPMDDKATSSSSKRSKPDRKSANQSATPRRRPKSPNPDNESNPFLSSNSHRRSRKATAADDDDTGMTDAFADKLERGPSQSGGHRTHQDENRHGHPGRYDQDDHDDDEDEEDEEDDEDDDPDDPFTSGFLGRHPAGLSALRQLTGMMSGTTQRLRGILEQLRSDDESIQLIALQELSEVLLISTEDNLVGHFSPDAYVKELVKLMQPPPPSDDPFTVTRAENPETMLLACRCLANLMEALPQATANVVYGNAVPVLCAKLLNIEYIDLAEQCLSTLEKISVEFPSAIVREGGLSACLNFLDFFATSTQRTAVTTAANCCRNIPEDSFSVVRDAMGTLEGILNNNDQKVVEQGCICVSRIVQSFKQQGDKLEELVSPGLLQAILRLLLPGSTNLIGSNIHTMFLQVLAYTAKASPRLSAELLKMNVVDTLYQILTGVSPPSGTEDVAAKIDSVVIMQALIHRPKDQIFETLNVICELLPDVPPEGLMYLEDLVDAGYPGNDALPLSSQSKSSANQQRLETLQGCKSEVKRFALILLPTLTDAYSSTVNLSVRQKVLTAHLKMLSNLDIDILEEALRPVPYASHLASIFTQQDHPTLVTYALQAAELLLKRLESIYRYQFYREGVISEISQLANRPCRTLDGRFKDAKATMQDLELAADSGASTTSSAYAELEQDMAIHEDVVMHSDDDEENDEGRPDHHDDEDDAQNENSDNQDEDDEDSDSSSSSGRQQNAALIPNADDIITLRAKRFIEAHEKNSDKLVRDRASAVLQDLKTLVSDIRSCVLAGDAGHCKDLFMRLASYFEGDALESITSYELKSSKIVEVLLEIFSAPVVEGTDPRSVFLEAFMAGNSKINDATGTIQPSTPFGVLVHTLQDLLSRSEHFDVITVHQHSYDSRGSATSMLAKQLRLKLVADEGSGIPKIYRNIMVSIHAIATFKALDDYLRPRISIAEQRPRGNKTRDQFAAYAQALAEGRAPPPPPPHTPSESSTRHAKKPSKSKSSPADASQSGPSSATREKTRRSNRRQEAQQPPPPPPPPPAMPCSNSSHDPVECADEERLTDPDSMDDESALDAIVDDLEDELDDNLPDPSAVSVEVAPTGQATAREEDGTRVATPTQNTQAAKPPPELSTPSSRLSALLQSSAMRQSLGGAASALSYAAAVQSIPQDWHIEFSVNDQPLSNETTIYRAVHFNQAKGPEISHRTVWNAVHTIKFKRVQGPPPTESGSLTPPPDSKAEALGMPASLNQHPVTSGILRLLSILHSLNTHLDDVVLDNKEQVKLNAEPLSQFVNTKLTAKLNRQLEEPLIVASNCLPSWSEDLARFYPFLFPFETRHLFLQSTSFGYSRSMTRWQNAQPTSESRRDRHRDERPFLGRLQRQKVRISRARILESAMKVMQLYGHSASVLEVEYFEEVGTGLGPTLEFYSTVSKEFSKKKLKLWRENESSSADEYAFGHRGLYPAPMSAEEASSENGQKRLELFKVLGKFVARSMLDSRIIDVSFNPTFFRIGDGSNSAVVPSLGAIKTVDTDLANSLVLLKQFADAKKRVDADSTLSHAHKTRALQNIMVQDCRVEDLALDFTLPGYDTIELIPNGSNTAVTIENVDTYVDKVIAFTLGSGVQRQADAFRAGFTEVFPYSALKAFTPDELVMLFGRSDEDWSLEST